MFIEAKDDWGGGDNWTTGVISRAKLQSNRHHQQTNILFFTGRMPFLSPNQQCQSTEWKISHSMDLLTRSSPGVFQLCFWPLTAPGYLEGGLRCLSSALWCQYPGYSYIMSRCSILKKQLLWPVSYNCSRLIIANCKGKREIRKPSRLTICVGASEMHVTGSPRTSKPTRTTSFLTRWSGIIPK